MIRLRVNRTFSIPIELVQELKKKHNQSETVTRALRKFLDRDKSIDIQEFTMSELLNEIAYRLELNSTEWKAFLVLNEMLA